MQRLVISFTIEGGSDALLGECTQFFGSIQISVQKNVAGVDVFPEIRLLLKLVNIKIHNFSLLLDTCTGLIVGSQKPN
jgi:hypothetical protein